MIRVGVVGATGYGGRELLRLLAAHPQVELAAAASTSRAGESLGEVLPAFRKVWDLNFEGFDAARMAESCDVVFIAVPGRESMRPVAELHRAGARVIDMGPDFRLKEAAAFEGYYHTQHTAPDLLGQSVYGLAPWYRAALADANLVAVPGCYPISILLPLRPLAEAPIARQPVIVNSISGISGAGRTPSDAFHFPEMNENLKAYKLGVHQHIPEIEQELLHTMQVQFTPHVAPLTRGILSTIVLRPEEPFDPALYYGVYQDEPFVRVLGEGGLPEVRQVRASNFCDFGWTQDARTGNLIIVSAIDNLMGGTAGMALQCMNIMFGIEESAGLRWGGMAP